MQIFNVDYTYNFMQFHSFLTNQISYFSILQWLSRSGANKLCELQLNTAVYKELIHQSTNRTTSVFYITGVNPWKKAKCMRPRTSTLLVSLLCACETVSWEAGDIYQQGTMNRQLRSANYWRRDVYCAHHRFV